MVGKVQRTTKTRTSRPTEDSIVLIEGWVSLSPPYFSPLRREIERVGCALNLSVKKCWVLCSEYRCRRNDIEHSLDDSCKGQRHFEQKLCTSSVKTDESDGCVW